ncbi:MAG: polysaccharide deacetylase family protein [Faecalibacillus sp.]
MKKKKYIIYLFLMIVILTIMSFLYFQNRKQLYLKNHPQIEINTDFDYKKYIDKVLGGNKSDVICQKKNLNLKKTGKYEVIFSYKNRNYPLIIEVVDTIKPEIKETIKLNILVNTEIDLNKGIEITDNSLQKPKITIDSSKLDTTKPGEYIITYIAEDQSGNKNIWKRKVNVIQEIGTNQQSDEKIVYLTFDDGPSSNTKKILDILDKYQVKATFFVTGTNQKYNYLIKEAHEKGHTIGLHTYCHEYNIIYSSVDAYFNDLIKLENMVEELIGYKPRYIRFPGGSSNKVSINYHKGIMTVLTKKVIQKGYQYYDWNCSTGDATGNNIPVETIIRYATAKNDQNLVMLAHDTDAKDTTVAALPSIIQYYQDKGYIFKAIDDKSFYAHQSINN